jgi:hypothetical protein
MSSIWWLNNAFDVCITRWKGILEIIDYSDSGEATCKMVPVHCTPLLFDYADSVSDPDLR